MIWNDCYSSHFDYWDSQFIAFKKRIREKIDNRIIRLFIRPMTSCLMIVLSFSFILLFIQQRT